MAARAAAIGANIAIGAMRRYGPRLFRRLARRRVGAAALGAVSAGTAGGIAVQHGRVSKKPRKVGPRRSRKAGPRTPVMKDEGAGYNQQQFHAFRKGRKLPASAIVRRTVLASAQREIYQWRNYSVDTTASSAFTLTLDHTVGATQRNFPLFLFDLTGRHQNQNGTPVVPTTCLRPYCDIAGANDGKIRWAAVNTMDSTGSAFSPYLQRTETTNQETTSSHSKSFLEWVDMRFNFMGCTVRPTKITVSLVKLLDDELDPWVTDGVANPQHQSAWQSHLAALTVNNIHVYTRPEKRTIQVLDVKTLEFQPISTTESDSRGHVHTLKWFYRANKMCKYGNGGLQVTDDASYSSRFLPANTAGLSTSPYADTKDRLFLLIKAYAPTTAAAFDRTIHPSFEANLRMKHTTMV